MSALVESPRPSVRVTLLLNQRASGIVHHVPFFRVCQLSTTYIDEGIEFPSLNQTEQGALKTDVLRQLHFATQGNRVDALDWDKLKMNMKACGGVASVSLVQSKGDKEAVAGHDEADLIVSEKGWRQGRGRGEQTGWGGARDVSYAQLIYGCEGL